MSDSFLYTSPADPRARPLLDELLSEYQSRYGTFFDAEGPKAEMNRYAPEAFQPPHGNFLLLIRDGVAIAGGAFMRHGPDTAELKRIWTDGRLRRQGLARKVLQELEDQAARQGYTKAFLTTGFRQPEAVGLYLTSGYTPLFDTSIDPETLRQTLPFEKYLDLPAAALAARGSHASQLQNTRSAHP
ncbi:GNAT family N-acetyltransferase [Allorhizobium taibaishanense]|uniref:GNAT family N-acetyltransferase n=1 Tax=Allorhizobium taibaishanense TaxID=887144 RepID=A0A1Q9A9V7_9HYPH|nr:GNAT family N-acetyltransferase [Allorhizobium taibaishanense]MBB4010041.1 GNAT superfamily N-acetyltransferase [Allorhizobium taibaishanense]OLP51649.1 GNAT family N-acetyltransferase [Allorhizobium taibaishanense]